ncbi:MAG: UvrD-helicase domain-containing protein, partial [Victivallales bacterium]|nr:UvrD-helicase domain-containing protein [Victivallales bacterium]
LVVTFTVAATAELRERLRGNLKQAFSYLSGKESDIDRNVLEIIKKAVDLGSETEVKNLLHKTLLEFDEAAIFTIHSFCTHMLSENAFESGSMFDVEMITEQEEIIDEVVEDYWRNIFYNSTTLSGLIQAADISLAEVKNSAYYIAKNPDTHFLPEGYNDCSPDELSEEVIEQVMPVIEYWKSNKETLLTSYEGIPLYSGSKKKMDPIFYGFRDAVEENSLYLDNLYKIRFLTYDKVLSDCKKSKVDKWEPESCLLTFFELCDKLKNVFDRFLLSFRYSLYSQFKTGRKLTEKKNSLRVRSYIDLLTQMRDGLYTDGKLDLNNPLAVKIRSMFKVALIDEFQDTDPIQFDIFTTIFSHSDSLIYMIGDPKQSIYRFRGADIFAYLSAKNDPDITEYTLDTNFRSVEPLVEAVDQWFDQMHSPNSFVYDGLKYNGVKASEKNKLSKVEFVDEYGESEPCVLYYYNSKTKPEGTKKVALHTADKIAEILNLSKKSKAFIVNADSNGNELRKNISPKDIAVLVRKNQEAGIMKRAFDRFSIPSVIQSTGNIFKSPEAVEVLRILTAINEYNNSTKLKTALCSRLIGLTPADIYNMSKEEGSSRYEYWLELFSSYKQLWEDKGFIRMFQVFLDSEENTDVNDERCRENNNVRVNIIKNGGGERSLTNILHLGELIHRESVKNKLGIDGSIQWLFEKINSDKKELESEDFEIRLDSDAEAVQIATIHSSKGLEYPIVFCPFIWTKSIKPHPAPGLRKYAFHYKGKQYCDLESPESHLNEVEMENLAEEVRLMYVAMTRAVYKLYLYFADCSNSDETSIYYLMSSIINHGVSLESDINPAKILKEPTFNIYNLQLKNTVIDTGSLSDFKIGRKYENIQKNKKELIRSPEKLINEGSITNDWGLMSYSSLVSGHHNVSLGNEKSFGEADTAEENISLQKEDTDINYPETSFFNFPRKGKYTGSFCHQILEQFNFNSELNIKLLDDQSLSSAIEIKLRNYGLIHGVKGTEEYNRLLEIRCRQVFDMLENVLLTPIPEIDKSFCLNILDEESIAKEMEFYYPVNRRIDPMKINDLFSGYSFQDLRKNDSMKRVLEKEKISLKQGLKLKKGYMNGSIDIVFEYHGKFYIADWKASWLGGKYEDYSKENILLNMASSGYFLQHNLYSVALHRLLKSKFNDYKQKTDEYFDKYFGGVFYFYLRGMKKDNSEYGYIFDRPLFEYINKLDNEIFEQ